MILSDNDPFGAKKWQDFVNQIDWLEKNNLVFSDVWSALESVAATNAETEKKLKQRRENLSKLLPKCPNCGIPMKPMPVNVSPATQTGDNSQCVLVCDKCHYEVWTEKSFEEVLRGETP